MAYATLSSPQFAAPLFDSVEITAPSGLGFTNSDRVELEASMSADSILTGITIRPTFFVFSGSGVPAAQVVIGVGADGFEVEIAARPIQFNFSFNTTGLDNGGFMPLPIPVDAIPEGSRLAACMRTSTTDFDQTYRVAATYIQKPIVGSLLTTEQPQVTIPHDGSDFANVRLASVYDRHGGRGARCLWACAGAHRHLVVDEQRHHRRDRVGPVRQCCARAYREVGLRWQARDAVLHAAPPAAGRLSVELPNPGTHPHVA